MITWETIAELAQGTGDLSLSGRRMKDMALLILGMRKHIEDLEAELKTRRQAMQVEDQEPMHMGFEGE